MKKKRMNNKGFSLVELIVVMAIMAILAVTLAPRLMQYVDKAKKAADKEVVNSIYTALEYGLMDSKSSTAVTDLGLSSSSRILLTTYEATPITSTADMYIISAAGEWTPNTSASTTATNYSKKTNALVKEIYDVVGNFKLKYSAGSTAEPQIVISGSTTDDLTVELFYDSDDGTGTADYTASATEVR